MNPADSEKAIAAKAPPMPPKPTTDATACFGKRSDARAKRFAAQPWWAAAASEIRPMATHRCAVDAASITGSTPRAQASMAVLRLALTDQPRRIRRDDSQPPPMLPNDVTV